MSFFIDFLIGARNLLAHTRRTLLLGGALAAVTALLLLAKGLGDGIRSTMMKSATTLTTGHINIAGFYKATAGQGSAVVTEYEKVLQAALPAIPDLDYVVARGRGWAKVISETGSIQMGLSGVNISREKGLREVLDILQGSLDALAEPGTALIFEEHAKKLEVKIGDALTLSASTPRGINNTVDVRVVAIAREMGLMSKFGIFVPEQTIRDLYQLAPTATGALHVLLKDERAIPATMERLRATLSAAGYRIMDHDPRPFWMKFEKVNRENWRGQKLDLTTWEDETSFLKWILTALNVLALLTIGTLLAIVALGIVSTLWIAIRERTNEIGTLRAIGMQRHRVLRMFLVEALLLGLWGTGAGALIAVAIAGALNAAEIHVPTVVQMVLMSDTLWIALSPKAVLFAVVFITALTTLASLFPSFRAARLAPVTAMHHIG